MIRLEDVSLRAPSERALTGALLLHQVRLELRAKELVAVVGPNGAGKSLLLQVLAGLRPPSEGRVHRDPADLRVGLVFQTPDDQIVGSTVERDLAFGLENLAVPPDEMHVRVDAMLERIGLADRRKTPPHRLSEGEKQRLALGAALLLRPALLLLDEPTSRLDTAGRRRFLQEVEQARAQDSTAVVLVTHRSEEALPADRIVGLRDGHVVFDGTPAALMRSPLADQLGMRWSALHRFRRELDDRGVPVPPAAGRWWNDPDVLLEQLGFAGTEA